MKIDKKYLWIILIVLSITLVLVIQVVRHSIREEERQVRIQIREAVKNKFPEAVKRVKSTYGLRPFELPELSEKRDAQTTEIILVHGLDEPGKVWMNLAPALVKERFPVRIPDIPCSKQTWTGGRAYHPSSDILLLMSQHASATFLCLSAILLQ